MLEYAGSLLSAIQIALSATIGIVFKFMFITFDLLPGFNTKNHSVKEASSYFSYPGVE
jgi:hypothetical protein